ncbi:alpha/beta-hydrolase [Sistotremastrum niveocremeum HHB9708]|uniref:Alpha/beta-hydrolase n=1 Tax=Sistotremastrum niveocremeum HHB9708 TaxID=1314777 RepID=A0A164WWI8_9AGAM|nr:alpha/beta-hydrolase [Sistotremastrum niveocremeum HHB9708]
MTLTSSPSTFTYKTVGDLDIELDVWIPELDSATPAHLPALVWFHGGGGFCGDKGPDKSQWFEQWIKDITVKKNQHCLISANYRLLIPTTAHHMIEDIKDVFTFISQKLSHTPIPGSSITIDPTKLAVGGDSFGGYCARLAGIYAEPKPKAVVSMFGMGGDFLSPFYLTSITDPAKMPFGLPLRDLSDPKLLAYYDRTVVETSTLAGQDEQMRPLGGERQELYTLTLQKGDYLDWLTGVKGLTETLKQNQGADSDEATKWLEFPSAAREVIPQFLLTPSFPPTFLLHGTADSAVLISESRTTERQLKDLGVETQFIAHEGGEHGFDAECKVVDGDPLYEELKPVEYWLKAKLA